jgi:rare lipoprotein A
VASYYGRRFAGRLTASGSRFNPAHLTAAHRTLPLGTVVKVTNLRNALSVVVEITDRGPYKYGRVIDLSTRAAREIGFIHHGLTQVRIEVLPISNQNGS